MSGHSKWSNIKNRKGAQDAKKGKVFSLIAKQIRLAVKEGASDDPKSNPSLRLALDKARAANMPKENVQRAIDRGMGRSSGGQLTEIIYEGFAPQGIGILVQAVTDNKQRTGGEVRHIFSKAGGSLGGPGSAMYLFSRSEDGQEYLPTMPIEITDPAQQEQLEELIDLLRSNEDVEDVYCAGTWPDAAE